MATQDRTPAQEVAERITDFHPDMLTRGVRSVSPDMLITAASHVSRNWGDYGYSVALVSGSLGWGLFRGHHSDGSDFWFVVDRYCNVADIAVER